MTTALYLLRAVQVGLHLSDLDELEVGTVMDMITESANDQCKYNYVATQDDFDQF